MSFNSIPGSVMLGMTLLPVGISVVTQVIPPRGTNGMYFGWQSGGTLSIIQGVTGVPTGGYVMGTTERMSVVGPLSFFLAAAGATAICGIVFSFSDGYSLQP
jgi:hypothetical protein